MHVVYCIVKNPDFVQVLGILLLFYQIKFGSALSTVVNIDRYGYSSGSKSFMKNFLHDTGKLEILQDVLIFKVGDFIFPGRTLGFFFLGGRVREPLLQILKICENPNFFPLMGQFLGGRSPPQPPHQRPPCKNILCTSTVYTV